MLRRWLPQTELVVTSAGPTGEVASLEQAKEIRIRFSEPMVALGRIPDQVQAPFFSIRPAIAGTGRVAGWSASDERLDWPLEPGSHLIAARDARGHRAEVSIVVR